MQEESAAILEITQSWLQSVESVLGADKDTYAMIVLLFKKYSKKRLDYEDLVNSIEELLPNDQNKRLLIKLDTIFDSKAKILEMINADQPQDSDHTIPEKQPTQERPKRQNVKQQDPVKADPVPTDDSESDQTEKGVKPNTRAKAKENNVPPSKKRKLAINVNMDLEEPVDSKTTYTPIESPLSGKTITNSPISYRGSQSPRQTNQILPKRSYAPLSENPEELAKDKHNLEYIVNSLAKHSDSAHTLYDDDEPIPIFQEILDKSEAGNFTSLDLLDKDIEDMLQSLSRTGIRVDRVVKHYEYLVIIVLCRWLTIFHHLSQVVDFEVEELKSNW
ncbi:hypothetical protein HK103_002975 [Boothiomyces macroporosus]|uniref:Uncharacterized protein n=1 Tax=Boothiomyces macroporosus TaxID=261099 RepID=A0AAD5UMV4_9FUNG|nr:hypothetical protein HK103_002975 [Boothiomyces macroporosus]